MKYQYNDGGRSKLGWKPTGDCVTRAIAIVSGRPYLEVYNRLAEGMLLQRKTKRSGSNTGKRSAANGVNTTRKWFKDYMLELGFVWTPTMSIGSGCKVHLKADELPNGKLVVAVSKHYTAVIDGIIYDTHDPQRDGTRCVYGYYRFEQKEE